MSSVYTRHILVCTEEKPEGIPGCAAAGGKELLEKMRAEVARAGLQDTVLVTGCSCLGLCRRGPNVVVQPEDRWYTRLAAAEVPELVGRHLASGEPLTGRDDPSPEVIRAEVIEHREHVAKVRAAQEKSGMPPLGLSGLMRGFMPARVVLTAVELDLFSAIEQGADTGEAVAARAGTDPRATEMLLNALAGMKLLVKAEGRFANGDWARTYLAEGGAHDSRAATGHLINLWRRWSHLTGAVKQGTAVEFKELADRDDSWTEPFIAAMHRNAAGRAPVVVRAINLDGVQRVLDLGGGSGAYAAAFAGARPEITATVLDLPTVTPLTRRYADQSGVGDRVRTVDGDLRTDAYGTDYDLVFISAICHMLGPEGNIAMLKKARGALKPGGRVVIQDFILDPDKTTPPSASLFALNMLVGTKEGRSYSEAEYRDWLAEAGFGEVRRIALPGPADLMEGRRG